jgi:hypothetical protein
MAQARHERFLRRGLNLSATALVAMALSACNLPSDTPPEISSPSVTNMPLPGSPATRDAGPTYATGEQVLESVRAAQDLRGVPDAVVKKLTDYDEIKLQPANDCAPVENPSEALRYGDCVYGDRSGEKLMVVYGDSHSDMWAATLMRVAAKIGWQLRVFAKHACPAPELNFRNPETNTPDEKCDVFHATAPDAVKALHPALVIVTSKSDWALADDSAPTPDQWRDGFVTTLQKLAQPGTRLAMLGDLPSWPDNTSRCLAAHLDAVQDCSAAAPDAMPAHLDAERAAAEQVGALYIPTTQWVCADRCEPVISDTRVFSDVTHLTDSYATYLTGAMTEALQLALG